MNIKYSFPIFQMTSKCQILLNAIFDHYLDFLNQELRKLSEKNKDIKNEHYLYKGLVINSRTFFNTFDPSEQYLDKRSFLHSSLNKEAEPFLHYVANLERDSIFMNQWLSIAIVNSIEETRENLPNFIANLHPIYSRVPLDFKGSPEGKEQIWMKAEQLAKYYLGFKLMI